MNSPKDYLTDRVREKILAIIKNYAGEGNDDFVNKLLTLLTSEVEKERERIFNTIEDAYIGEELLYGEWIQIKKALSDIGGGK